MVSSYGSRTITCQVLLRRHKQDFTKCSAGGPWRQGDDLSLRRFAGKDQLNPRTPSLTACRASK